MEHKDDKSSENDKKDSEKMRSYLEKMAEGKKKLLQEI